MKMRTCDSSSSDLDEGGRKQSSSIGNRKMVIKVAIVFVSCATIAGFVIAVYFTCIQPGPPTVWASNITSTSVVIHVNPPFSYGGLPLLSYTIHQFWNSEWKTFATFPVNITSYSVTGLTPNITHFFVVAAGNALGYGNYSNQLIVTLGNQNPTVGRRKRQIQTLDVQNCTFEEEQSLCGQNITSSVTPSCDQPVYMWERHSGGTWTYRTGPDFDHTSMMDKMNSNITSRNQTGEGHYMYVDASFGNPGDTTTLKLEDFLIGKFCSLRFFYHMYGISTPILHVRETRTHINKVLPSFNLNTWIPGCLELKTDCSVHESTIRSVSFDAERGNGPWGDIAIDDISLSIEKCPDTSINCTFADGMCGYVADYSWTLLRQSADGGHLALRSVIEGKLISPSVRGPGCVTLYYTFTTKSMKYGMFRKNLSIGDHVYLITTDIQTRMITVPVNTTGPYNLVVMFKYFNDVIDVVGIRQYFSDTVFYLHNVTYSSECPAPMCQGSDFACEHHCILAADTCDGHTRNCRDGRDETDKLCPPSLECDFNKQYACNYTFTSAYLYMPKYNWTTGILNGSVILRSLLSFMESPKGDFDSESCLQYKYFQYGEGRHRLVYNTSDFLQDLYIFDGLRAQGIPVTLQASLPPGNYSIIFEFQDNSNEFMHYAQIDDVEILNGSCHNHSVSCNLEEEFLCHNTMWNGDILHICLPNAAKCNRHVDCSDGSDEMDCRYSLECNFNEHLCGYQNVYTYPPLPPWRREATPYYMGGYYLYDRGPLPVSSGSTTAAPARTYGSLPPEEAGSPWRNSTTGPATMSSTNSRTTHKKGYVLVVDALSAKGGTTMSSPNFTSAGYNCLHFSRALAVGLGGNAITSFYLRSSITFDYGRSLEYQSFSGSIWTGWVDQVYYIFPGNFSLEFSVIGSNFQAALDNVYLSDCSGHTCDMLGLIFCFSNDQCYHRVQRCNGYFDCRDQSDEWNCHLTTTTPSSTTEDMSTTIARTTPGGLAPYIGHIDNTNNGTHADITCYAYGDPEPNITFYIADENRLVDGNIMGHNISGNNMIVQNNYTWFSYICVATNGFGSNYYLFNSTNSVTSSEVRLVGGQNQDEGRVEVYFDGFWGTICDDLWDDNDAAVVCRMLGYSTLGATAVCCAQFGSNTNLSISLDDVECTGNESSIYDCSHNQWYSNDCNHNEDAGVHCGHLTSTTPLSTTKGQGLTAMTSGTKTSTTTARTTPGNTLWTAAMPTTTVIPDGCHQNPVPACIQYGFERIIMPSIAGQTSVIEAGNQLIFFISHIESQSLFDYQTQKCIEHLTQFLCGSYMSDCEMGKHHSFCRESCEVIARNCVAETLYWSTLKMEYFCKFLPYQEDDPSCLPINMPDLDSKPVIDGVRLVNGTSEFSGSLEVQVNGAWRTVCGSTSEIYTFDVSTAAIFCLKLGFSFNGKWKDNINYGHGLRTHITYIHCGYGERYLDNCTISLDSDCAYINDRNIGLECVPANPTCDFIASDCGYYGDYWYRTNDEDFIYMMTANPYYTMEGRVTELMSPRFTPKSLSSVTLTYKISNWLSGKYMLIVDDSQKRTVLWQVDVGKHEGIFWDCIDVRNFGGVQIHLVFAVENGQPLDTTRWTASGLVKVTVNSRSCPGVFPAVACTFESMTACPFVATCNGKDSYRFQLTNGPSHSSHTELQMNPTIQNYAGHYMIANATYGVEGDSADLKIPVSVQPRQYYLRYQYNMSGPNIGNLQVHIIEKNGATAYFIHGHREKSWYPACLTLPFTNLSVFDIVFKAVRGNGTQGDIAIDDIELNSKPCPSLNVSSKD